MIAELKKIVELIADDGQITLGHVDPIRNCVATTADEARCPAMLVRRDGETLDDLGADSRRTSRTYENGTSPTRS